MREFKESKAKNSGNSLEELLKTVQLVNTQILTIKRTLMEFKE